MVFGCCSDTVKGISTEISGILTHLVLGSSYSFGLLSPYLMSYLKQFDSKITVSDGFFMLPIILLSIAFTLSFGGLLEKKYGPRLPMTIGGLTIVLCYVGLHFAKTLWLCYLLSVLFGLGQGLCYFPPIRTAWYYFPKRKGIVLGTIVCGFGLSGAILTFVIKLVVNPLKIHSEKGNGGFYPEEVYKNVPKYFLVMVIATGTLSILALILVQPFQGDKSIVDIKEEPKIEKNSKEVELVVKEDLKEPTKKTELVVKTIDPLNDSNYHLHQETHNHDLNDLTHAVDINHDKKLEEKLAEKPKEKEREVNLLKAIFSLKNFLVLLLAFLNYYLPVCIINTFKTFSLNYQDTLDESFISWCSFILYLGNGLSRSMWGLLYDKFGYKKLMLVNSTILIIISVSFYFTTKIRWLFMIEIIVVSILAGSPMTLAPNGIQLFFGTKYSSEIYGLTFYAFGISGFVAPILSKILKLGSTTSTTPFLVIYLVGGGFGIISIIILLTMSMEPYQFEYKDEKKEKEKEVK